MSSKRSKMCSVKQIVEYWEKACYKYRTEKLPIYLDLGEPTCFACGEYWKGDFDNRRGFAGWNAAPLDRAHIIPRSLGGPNDDPSNFVMLCDSCHPQNPHTKSRPVFMKWLHSVKPSRDLLLRNLKETWFSDKEDLEIAAAVWSNPTEVDHFYDWCAENTSYHASFGKVNFSWSEKVQKMFPDLVAYIKWVKENGNYDNSNLSKLYKLSPIQQAESALTSLVNKKNINNTNTYREK